MKAFNINAHNNEAIIANAQKEDKAMGKKVLGAKEVFAILRGEKEITRPQVEVSNKGEARAKVALGMKEVWDAMEPMTFTYEVEVEQGEAQKADNAEQGEVFNSEHVTADLEGNGVKEYSFNVNADGHYILKAQGYLVKFQASKKGVKIRINEKMAKATEATLATEYHKGWTVKYEVLATVEEVLGQFIALVADKAQKAQAVA